MTSRLLSQIFNQNSASIYETLRQHDAAVSSDSDLDDIEERAGILPAQGDFPNEYERSDEGVFELSQPIHDHPTSTSAIPQERQPLFSASLGSKSHRYTSDQYKDEEDNTEVPESLLFEAGAVAKQDNNIPEIPRGGEEGFAFPSGRGASGSEAGYIAGRTHRLEEQWEAATRQNYRQPGAQDVGAARKRARLGLIDPRERALWKWANVENLDNFLNDVYDYYLGKGIYNIMLTRLLNLLTLLFVVAFSTFLGRCINYNAIHNSKRLSDITIEHCMSKMSGTATVLLWTISFYWTIKLTQYILDIRRLWDVHNFFVHLLDIPDSDMQSISWQEVVARLMALRDANPNTSAALHRRNYSTHSKQRMDAQDIANRLMRRENYMIALFNKDVLDLTVPLPILRHKKGMLTRTLEWNLSLCILDFAFNEQGQLRTLFLKDTHRRTLSDGLRSRFLFAGCMNIIFAPFIATYFLLVFLLRNLNDFIKTPARIGHRQYTPLAEWKFRGFNELYHLFHRRLNMSYPAAEAYVEQFPKEKTVQVARFVSFIASSLLGVLAIGTLIDYELISGFEIVRGFNALTCIGVLTTVVAVTRGMLPEDNTVYDPEWSLRNVIQHTHYMPADWKDKLHSDDVKRDFMTLYDLKVSIFLQEVLSVIFTPFVLWFSLPKCSDRIIDFFREFTVHVDGVGYVCSFAHFNFQKPGQENTEDLRGEYFSSKDNKMLTSYLGFISQYHGDQAHKRGTGRRYHSGQAPHMTSPLMAASVAGISGSKWPITPRGVGNVGRSSYENPGKTYASLTSSTLLDHHHQPPANLMTRTARPNAFHPPTGIALKEEDEVGSADDEKVEKYRSNLGESFVSTRLSGTMAADEDRSTHTGAGVLDLLNQFVGAHGGESTGRAGVI